MPQPPFKTDVLQVEPAAVGSRLIDRDSTTGGLRFTDPAFPLGVLLADLAGFQTLDGVLLVGSGNGQYTTIQSAIDAVTTNPATILIAAGTYSENLTISADGVELVAQGRVVITSAADATIHIVESAVDVPRQCRLTGLTVVNTLAGKTCIFVDGTNTFASGTVTVNTFPLASGDTVTIGGIPLTGVAGARTSGSDNFNASFTSTSALATEIAAALNDLANSFATTVAAVAVGAVVTITAVTPGAGGNAITLAAVTTPGGNLTVSGATFTGGGGLDSEVGEVGVYISGCTLLATGVGTQQIATDTVNNVFVDGGTWEGSASTSECLIAQTASFRVVNVGWVSDIQVAYDTGNPQPSVTTSEFVVRKVDRVGDMLVNLLGAGSTQLSDCPEVGDVAQAGDRSFYAIGCRLGDLSFTGSVDAHLTNSTRGTLGGSGTSTVAESALTTSSVLVAASTDAVVFGRPQPDAVYVVLVDVPVAGVVANTTTKTATGFTVTFSAPVTGTVFYTIIRQM